jgi:hypothetical protein
VLKSDEEIEFKRLKEESIPDWKERWQKYMFFFYDGVSFFGFADYKLGRIRGKSPSWCDKCHSKAMIPLVFVIFIQVYVFVSEFWLIGKLRNQTVDLEPGHKY